MSLFPYKASLQTMVVNTGEYRGACGYYMRDEEGLEFLDVGYAPQSIPSDPHEIVRTFFSGGFQPTIRLILDRMEEKEVGLSVNGHLLPLPEVLEIADETGQVFI